MGSDIQTVGVSSIQMFGGGGGIKHSDVWGVSSIQTFGGVSSIQTFGGYQAFRRLSIQTFEDQTFVDGWCF